MSEIENITDLFERDENLRPLGELIQSIMDLDDNSLTDSMQESLIGMINGGLSPSIKREAITAMIKGFEDQGYTRMQAINAVNLTKEGFNDFVDTLKPSAAKRNLIDNIFGTLFEIFDVAVEQYHTYNIDLPIMLEEGAQIPMYAHESDAAADLYAREMVVIPAHSFSNKIDTGVHIGLPEGWLAHIAPRSSIGAKTPLRLSNMLGVIDSGYRGPLIVMFDNVSDSDYTINAGDRIAQLWVTPSYHFKPQIVSNLDETDRNEGGLGSTGV